MTGLGLGAGGLKLPAGVRLATNPNPTTNCAAGTASVGGTDTVFMAGANLDRRGYCTVSVSVVSDAAAVYTASALANSLVANSAIVAANTYTNNRGHGTTGKCWMRLTSSSTSFPPKSPPPLLATKPKCACV
ncbi:MAG: hypothetical protein HC767_04355 [Akkermansiaceae bacterium]|nr:hypothetical protein [Akkermansiaceae bacterium]